MSQLIKKYIGDDQVDDAKLLLRNNGTLRARNAANNANIDILKVTTADLVEVQSLFEVNSALAIPWKPKHYATIEYIENYLKGKTDAKDAVNVLADSNTPLTGATPLVRDGLTVLNTWRVALTDQTDPVENGIYDMEIVGGNYTLTRSSDFDQVEDAGGLEVTSGCWAKVIGGTTYGGWEFQLTTSDPIVIDTTALTFAKYPSTLAITAGDMIKRTGNDLTIDLATISGLESDNPGNPEGKLRIRADTATLVKDKTLRIDSGTNGLVAPRHRKYTRILDANDISNGYVDLSYVAATDSIDICPKGAPPQFEDDDYTVNYTGGAGGNTRITFDGNLATLLAAGETLYGSFRSF